MKSKLLCLFLCLTPFGVGAEFVHYPSRTAALNAATSSGKAWGDVAYTGSMKPTLRGGEFLLLEPITWPAKKGELLIYRNGATRTVHRVVDDNGRAVFMSGDANRYSDGWIKRDRFLWRVVKVLTWAK